MAVSVDVPANALEPVRGLLYQQLDHAPVVVAGADRVIERREAMQLARLLHRVERRLVESWLADSPPVFGRVVVGKARRQRAVDADDERVQARTAVPRLVTSAAQEAFLLGRRLNQFSIV